MLDEWLKAWGAAATADPAAAFAAAWQRALREALDGRTARDRAAEQFADFLRGRFAEVSAVAGFGPHRSEVEGYERFGQALIALQDAQARLARLWSDALREAALAFADRRVDPAALAQPPIEVYDAWIDQAEAAYARVARGEAYCAALADFMQAQADLRTAQRALIERFARELDLPTRAELNSVHRAVQALRTEARRATHPPARAPRAASKRAAPKRAAPKRAASKRPPQARPPR